MHVWRTNTREEQASNLVLGSAHHLAQRRRLELAIGVTVEQELHDIALPGRKDGANGQDVKHLETTTTQRVFQTQQGGRGVRWAGTLDE